MFVIIRFKCCISKLFLGVCFLTNFSFAYALFSEQIPNVRASPDSDSDSMDQSESRLGLIPADLYSGPTGLGLGLMDLDSEPLDLSPTESVKYSTWN